MWARSPRSPKTVDVFTPNRDKKVNLQVMRPTRSSKEPSSRAQEVPRLGLPSPSGSGSDSEDLENSPRLPSNWLPLEYELLEYATMLPPGFAERVAAELEAQERRVAQLRSLNALLAIRVSEEQGSAKPSPPKARTPDSVIKQRAVDFKAEARAEVARRLAMGATARQLEECVREVRRAAEFELQELAARERGIQAQHRMLINEAAEDVAHNRKRLWEVETKLQKLHARRQQLENAKRHADRKAAIREQEERDLKAEVEYLQTEVEGFRKRAQEFDTIDQQEEELRQKLKAAKLQLRAANREKAASIQDSIMAKISNRVSAMEVSLSSSQVNCNVNEAASKVARKIPDTRTTPAQSPRIQNRAITPVKKMVSAAASAVATPLRTWAARH